MEVDLMGPGGVPWVTSHPSNREGTMRVAVLSHGQMLTLSVGLYILKDGLQYARASHKEDTAVLRYRLRKVWNQIEAVPSHRIAERTLVYVVPSDLLSKAHEVVLAAGRLVQKDEAWKQSNKAQFARQEMHLKVESLAGLLVQREERRIA